MGKLSWGWCVRRDESTGWEDRGLIGPDAAISRSSTLCILRLAQAWKIQSSQTLSDQPSHTAMAALDLWNWVIVP